MVDSFVRTRNVVAEGQPATYRAGTEFRDGAMISGSGTFVASPRRLGRARAESYHPLPSVTAPLCPSESAPFAAASTRRAVATSMRFTFSGGVDGVF